MAAEARAVAVGMERKRWISRMFWRSAGPQHSNGLSSSVRKLRSSLWTQQTGASANLRGDPALRGGEMTCVVPTGGCSRATPLSLGSWNPNLQT